MVNSKIISKETVFASRYFKVKKTTIKRDGKEITKDILEITPTVIILPIDNEGNIYLIEQFRDSFQKVLIETVAGHVEKGEAPLEAAKKELREEAGLTAKSWKQIGTLYVSANIDTVVHVFFATDLKEGEQDLDDEEDITVVKIPFTMCLKKIEKGEIKVSANIAAIMLLDKLMREEKI